MRNWDDLIKSEVELDTPKYENNFPYPTNNFRWLIAGPSNSGKTNLLMDALFEGLKFDKLYLFVKDPYESKYQFLIKHFTKLEKQIKEETGEEVELLVVGTEQEDIPRVEDLDKRLQNVMVIDDFVVDKKAMDGPISDHFIRGRKKMCSYIMLQQSYFRTPKLIRINCDNFSLFEMPTKGDIRNIISDHSLDKDYDELKALYRECVKEKYNFFHIDKKTSDKNMRYRKNLDGFFMQEQE